jgi:hypothetical protein
MVISVDSKKGATGKTSLTAKEVWEEIIKKMGIN